MNSFACIVAAVVLGQSQIVVLQTEDEVSTNGEVQVSAAIDSNSILGMTGPGGLGDRPHLPTVRIKSDYDLDAVLQIQSVGVFQFKPSQSNPPGKLKAPTEAESDIIDQAPMPQRPLSPRPQTGEGNE